MIFINKKGRIVYANKKCEEVMGYTREEFYSPDFDFMTMMAPESVDLTRENFARHMRGEEVEPYDYCLVNKTGERIEAINSSKLITYEGEPAILGIVTDITEHKKAEEELRQYDHIVSSSTDMMALLDKRFTYVAANASYLETFKKTRGEVIGRTAPEVFGKEFFETVIKPKAERCLAGEEVNYQAWFDFPASEPRYMDINYYPYTGINNEVLGFVVNGRDITERKRADEALQKQKEELQIILDSVPAGIWYKDTENRLLRVNQAAAKSVNMKPEDVEGMAVCDLFPRDAEHYFQDDLEVIRSGKPKLGIVERMQVPEGKSRWVRTDKIPYRDEQGNVSRVIAFVEDITECKKAEEQLRQESLMRKTILDNLPCVAMIVKKQTREIVASNEAAREVGATPGKTCYGTCAEREHPCPFCLAPEIWATNEPRRLEVEYRERHYDRIWVPLTEDLYVHYIFDITERKGAEQKVLDDREQLKSLASQLSLTEERERHRIATELHDQIGQSLVISKIKLDQLRQCESAGAMTGALDEVSRCLGQVIADTRTLTFDLSHPILYELGFEAAVADWLTEQIEEKHGLETDFEDDGHSKPLDDDIRALLFRNVRELLINVVKHAQAGHVKVSVRRADKDICVCVEDDGMGFDPVEVAAMAAKRAEFGLFSIRERLEQLGGHIEIESRPGLGTKITMNAPLKYGQLNDRTQT
ncbi:MAG: sensor histidine kinase [Planctomycetota bacterium]|jgi:PAS domain S-box-containing protein